ncbi:MAG: hypothetical protein FJ319_08135 [SAR202 cluster bacterium]|nr:hypothetical protein [SAR202 cluster bacterium]
MSVNSVTPAGIVSGPAKLWSTAVKAAAPDSAPGVPLGAGVPVAVAAGVFRAAAVGVAAGAAAVAVGAATVAVDAAGIDVAVGASLSLPLLHAVTAKTASAAADTPITFLINRIPPWRNTKF